MAPEPASLAVVQALGAQATQWFAGALGVLLLVVAALGWMLRRHASRRDRHPPVAGLAGLLVLGFAIVVVAGMVFAFVARLVDAGESLGRFDQAFSDAVRQGASVPALAAFGTITHLGDTLTLTLLVCVVATVLLVRRERMLAFGYAAAVVGNALLNTTLKGVFERVRPVHDGSLAYADGYSFPSGHSSGAVVAYGMVAYVLVRTLPERWHLPAMLLGAAVAFSVACSRVFLQVHFATDVIAGIASGGAWLAVCVVSLEALRRRRDA